MRERLFTRRDLFKTLGCGVGMGTTASTMVDVYEDISRNRKPETAATEFSTL